MKKIVLLSLSAVTIFFHSVCFSESIPTPNVPTGCDDKSQTAKGHWTMLLDGQYGAESLDKLEKGHKWKIAKREKETISFIWCSYFNTPATTEQLNDMFATGNSKFVQMPIKDSGKWKTTGFWIYK